jgi:lysozyme family protein
MKRFLDYRSRRWGFDGWAIRIKGAKSPFDWSVCTTRQEARELRKEALPERDLFSRSEIVKVRISLEVLS